MPNVFEVVINMLKTRMDEDRKKPLHIGEAMACWMYLASLDESLSFEEAGLNTTSDNELNEVLHEYHTLCKEQSDNLKAFMTKEGIPFPPLSEPKPESQPNAVPLGVKLTDNQLANGMSIKAAASMNLCAEAAAQSIRGDVATMFLRFFTEQLILSSTVKNLLLKRGWIKYPPAFTPPGVPTT